MASFARPPQRTARVPPRKVVDENAAARHARQASGIPIGIGRLAQKDVVSGPTKLLQTRTALGEVTTTTVNRKENSTRLIIGNTNNNKDKEEVGHKRSRSNSNAAEHARIPLGPKGHIGAPVRIPLSRHRQQHQHVHVHVPPKRQIIETTTVLLEEAQDDLGATDDDEMDVEEEQDQILLHRDQLDSDAVEPEADSSAEQEVERMVGIEGTVQPAIDDEPRVWPDITPARAAEYEKKVDAIREVFQDFSDECDPTMVSEYADDIFKYMAELEEEVMPNANYIETQTDLSWDMRELLVDWLQQIHIQYHMLPETLWIAVNLMDRFLSMRVVSRTRLQLVGLACMFIACKYEEITAPSVDEFVLMANRAYEKEDVLKGERIILQELGFHVSHYCSPYSWMRKISKADDYDLQTRTLSKFLTEVTLMDHRFLRVKPSLIAAVGMYSARMMLGGDWNEAFVFHSGYTEEQLLPGHRYIAEKLNENGFTSMFIYKKYAHKKFLKASTFATQWARTHRKSEAEAAES